MSTPAAQGVAGFCVSDWQEATINSYSFSLEGEGYEALPRSG
jgi:hypothetical protein